MTASALSQTSTPTISGTAQWHRGSTAISGATAQAYEHRSSDRGWKLRVVVTGSKSGYTSVSKTSAWTATVTR